MGMSRFVLPAFVLAVAVCVPARAAHAQGKGHGRGHGAPPGHAKKHVVTTDRAIVVTREVLVSHGYEFVRVERLGEFHSSPGMVAESFTLVRAHGVGKVGDGGGTHEEDITVYLVPRDEIPAFVRQRRDAGIAVDVKLLLFLKS